MINPVPQSVLKAEMKCLPLFRLPCHAVDASLFETMKGHDVGGSIPSYIWGQTPQNTVGATRWRVKIHDGKPRGIAPDQARQLNGKLEFFESAGNVRGRRKVAGK